MSSVADITERKRGEREREELLAQFRALNAELEQRVQARTAELSATLREREVLLQEIHHRVKNNLQVISSLIAMQMRRLADAVGREALQECQTRVQAIALIHKQLYRAKDFARVPFKDYTRSLVFNLFHATGTSTHTVRLELAIDDVDLTVDKAIPCGLILNELVTNALKHAFVGERAGTLRVALTRAPGGRLVMQVQDDGVGIPDTIDARATKTLGMRLVFTLAEQLDAVVEHSRLNGTSFALTFSEVQ